jgi:hypothetical protein
MGKSRLFLTWSLLTLSMTVAGCGTSATVSGNTAGSNDKRDAVVLEYIHALISGDDVRAKSLVEPKSQAALQIVIAGIDPKMLRAKDLRIGSSEIDGDRAIMTIMGTICRAGTPTAENAKATVSESCTTNNDSTTSNPIFKVVVERQLKGDWMVSLNGSPGEVPPHGGPSSTPQASVSSMVVTNAP